MKLPTTENPSVLPKFEDMVKELYDIEDTKFMGSEMSSVVEGAKWMRSIAEPIIATQQSEIERLKAANDFTNDYANGLAIEKDNLKSELEEVTIWIQLNGWQFSTVFASKDSAWINPKTNEVKSFTELYTIYQSQKQKT